MDAVGATNGSDCAIAALAAAALLDEASASAALKRARGM